MAAESRAHGDIPLFREDAVIHTTRDVRTVGEMLVDVGHLTRDLLIDVDGDDAAAVLRAWPSVAGAANDLWNALPRHVLEGDTGSQMERIAAMTETIASSMNTGWPGPGELDPRMRQIAETLAAAAKLVQRYSGEVALERPSVRHDTLAARARTVQGLYFATHAVSVALHQHGRDRYFDAREAGEALPLSSTQSPYAVAPTSRWLQRIQSCERLAGDYLRGRLLRDLEGEVRRAPDDAGRLHRALTLWDIRAHRALAGNPSPANLVIVTRTQGMIAAAGLAILEAAAQCEAVFTRDQVARLLPALAEAGTAWSNLGSRWGDLATPTTPADGGLLHTAAEVRAACRELTHDTTTMASLEQIAGHPGLPAASRAVLAALACSPDLAHVCAEQSARSDLAGPARALSLRAHNDVEEGLFIQGSPGTDTVWVSPTDILNRRHIALPEPVAAGLLAAGAATATSAARIGTRAAAMLDSGELATSAASHEPAAAVQGRSTCSRPTLSPAPRR